MVNDWSGQWMGSYKLPKLHPVERLPLATPIQPFIDDAAGLICEWKPGILRERVERPEWRKLRGQSQSLIGVDSGLSHALCECSIRRPLSAAHLTFQVE